MDNDTARQKAYSYLRFSTPEQMRGDSFRRQSAMAQQWAARNNVELDEKLTFQDLGVSAYKSANAETGMLGEFREAARAGMIAPGSYLLIESLDRLSRDTARKAMRLLEDICEQGVAVVTLSDGKVYTDDNLSSDPISFMMAFMVMIRANEESATKARRLGQAWSEKRRRAVEHAEPITPIAPAWLELDRISKAFKVIDDRAETVRRIFRMTLDGLGQNQIADTFNREGVVPFGRGRYWHKTYVSKILDNPAVIGTFTPHTLDRSGGKKRRIPQSPIPFYFPAVVNESVFQDVQAQRIGGASVARQGGRHPIASLLAGLAQCPLCEGSMTRVVKGARGGLPKFVCARAKTGAGCRYQSVPVAHVEYALVRDAEWLVANAPAGDGELEREITRHRSNLETVVEHLTNTLAAISEGAAGPAINTQLRELETAKEELSARLDDLEQRQSAETGKLVERRLADLVDALAMRPLDEWTAEDRQLANACLRQVVQAIVVDYRSGTLEVCWKHGGVSSIVFAPGVEHAAG